MSMLMLTYCDVKCVNVNGNVYVEVNVHCSLIHAHVHVQVDLYCVRVYFYVNVRVLTVVKRRDDYEIFVNEMKLQTLIKEVALPYK